MYSLGRFFLIYRCCCSLHHRRVLGLLRADLCQACSPMTVTLSCTLILHLKIITPQAQLTTRH